MADDAAGRRAASAGAPEAQKTFAKACANSLEWHYKAAQRAGAPPSRPTILESDSKRPGWYEPPDATAAPPRVDPRLPRARRNTGPRGVAAPAPGAPGGATPRSRRPGVQADAAEVQELRQVPDRAPARALPVPPHGVADPLIRDV